MSISTLLNTKLKISKIYSLNPKNKQLINEKFDRFYKKKYYKSNNQFFIII